MLCSLMSGKDNSTEQREAEKKIKKGFSSITPTYTSITKMKSVEETIHHILNMCTIVQHAFVLTYSSM